MSTSADGKNHTADVKNTRVKKSLGFVKISFERYLRNRVQVTSVLTISCSQGKFVRAFTRNLNWL